MEKDFTLEDLQKIIRKQAIKIESLETTIRKNEVLYRQKLLQILDDYITIIKAKCDERSREYISILLLRSKHVLMNKENL